MCLEMLYSDQFSSLNSQIGRLECGEEEVTSPNLHNNTLGAFLD